MLSSVPEKKARVFTAAAVASGWAVAADGQSLKTPAGTDLIVPTESLAKALAEEWRAQGDKPKPASMPMMQFAATAIDRVLSYQAEIVSSVASCAASDLLCHRAEEPAALAGEQTKIWQPWLDWAAQSFGISLNVGVGVMPVWQSPEALQAAMTKVAIYDAFYLVGLQEAVSVTGSLVLGLALLEQQASVEEVFDTAELETLFQMRQWGEDPVTVDRHASLRRDLDHCARWFELLRG